MKAVMVVEARAMLLHGLQVQAKQEPGGGFRRASSFKDDASSSSEQLSTPRMPTSPTKAWLPLENVALQQNKYFDMEKHSILTSEVEFVDKHVVKEGPTILQTKVKDKALNEALDVEDDDEWPEDETLDMNVDGVAGMQFCNEEDISFSDLEDDAYPIKSSKLATHSAVKQ
ncbi:hypothetical protein HPP92_008252 [Vanilla planifolia]|uniref:Uncharacterized protein n=1 Tax=Vanilla planifolia TaxID=51239 RepID=A0A835RCZ8_VANPL|nr:hypothetical protein HPP92_008252 [Vanilla planifolia]